MKVGKYKLDNGVKAKCLLPGTKRRRGELPQLALRRLLSEDLTPCAAYLKFNGVDHVVETTDKGKYDLPAKYLKTVHHGIYDEEKASKPIGKTVCCCWGGNVDHSGNRVGHLGNISCGRKLAPHDLPEHILLRPDSREELDVYCWLPANQFEALFAGEHQDVLQTWLSSFQICSETIAATLSMDLEEDIVEAEQTCDTNVQCDSCGHSENSSSLESEASLEALKAMRVTPRAASKGPDITVAMPDPNAIQYV